MQNKLSIILSSYNEKDNIKKTLDILIKDENVYEIIVVDDNSTDGTLEILNQIKNEKLNFILRKNTKGFASAFIYGLMISKGDIICRFDIDMHDDIKLFLSHVDKMKTYEALIFSRYVENGDDKRSGLRKNSSYILNLICRYILSSKVKDYTSCVFLIRRSIFEDVIPVNTGYANFIIEFIYDLIKKDKKVCEIPYIQKKSTEDNSKSAANYYTFLKNGLLYFITIFKCIIFKKFIT